jgi:hypothetical protein
VIYHVMVRSLITIASLRTGRSLAMPSGVPTDVTTTLIAPVKAPRRERSTTPDVRTSVSDQLVDISAVVDYQSA